MIIAIRVNKLFLRSKTKSSSLPTPEYLSYTRIWRAHTGVMTEGVDIVLARGGVCVEVIASRGLISEKWVINRTGLKRQKINGRFDSQTRMFDGVYARWIADCR